MTEEKERTFPEACTHALSYLWKNKVLLADEIIAEIGNAHERTLMLLYRGYSDVLRRIDVEDDLKNCLVMLERCRKQLSETAGVLYDHDCHVEESKLQHLAAEVHKLIDECKYSRKHKKENNR